MPSREVIEAARGLVGRTVRGKWRLDALLGVGGSAAVYAATHRNGKRGALKILRSDLANDFEVRDRFLREGYVANLVGHPGAVAMLDDDVDDDGSPFLVMELLAGSTLERILRKKKSMPLREVLRIAESVLDVLAAAHAHGIVHGDIKPGNVFITVDNEVKLLDFGIARLAQGPASTPGEALGTPAYMSPEQARGDAVDGRADLWALGALMFALITGKRPRQGESAGDELLMASSDPMPRLADVAPQVRGDIADVVDRALSFDRATRWPDATTMQQALRLALLLEQAAGPAEAGLQVPLPSPMDEERTLVDVRIFKPSESKHLRAAADARLAPPPLSRRYPASAKTRTAVRAAPTPPTPASGGRISTLPPGVTTGHRLAFAASLPPPGGDDDVPTQRRPLPRAAMLTAALVVMGLGLGLAFTGTMFATSESSSTLGAPTAGGADAGADATDASKTR